MPSRLESKVGTLGWVLMSKKPNGHRALAKLTLWKDCENNINYGHSQWKSFHSVNGLLIKMDTNFAHFCEIKTKLKISS